MRFVVLAALTAAMTVAAKMPEVAQMHTTLMEEQLDSLARSRKIVSLDDAKSTEAERTAQNYSDSVQRIVNEFYYDQFRHFQDPAAPYFLFMSKDAGLAMGIGGCVRMRGYYDWGGAVPAAGFSPWLIPMTPDPLHERKFGTTPSGSSLFFRVIGRNKALGDYQLYIECNFTGYEGLDFRLKKAYAVINDFTVGYAASTFSDPTALPPTIDAQGPTNKITPTNVLVRWMRHFRKNWSVALSAETPSTEMTAPDSIAKKVDEWLPDFAAFVQYQWSAMQHVRLSGIVRTLSYRDMIAQRNRNVVGWGLMLSTVVSPWRPVTIYATVNGGRGIESLGGDLKMGGYDLRMCPGDPGRMYAPASVGYNIGVQYNFRRNIYSCLSYSQTRYLPRQPREPGEYKSGQVIAFNTFWNMTERMMAGAEFVIGARTNFSGERRWARRAALMCQFSF